MAVYIAMKRRIFDRQTAQDVAVFNYDDATCREMAKGLKAQVAWVPPAGRRCPSARMSRISTSF